MLEAKKLRLVVPQGAGMFLVRSNSRRSEYHAVDVNDRTCTCESFHFSMGEECTHIKFVDELLKKISQLDTQTACA